MSSRFATTRKRASAAKPIAPGTAGMTDHMDLQQGANLCNCRLREPLATETGDDQQTNRAQTQLNVGVRANTGPISRQAKYGIGCLGLKEQHDTHSRASPGAVWSNWKADRLA